MTLSLFFIPARVAPPVKPSGPRYHAAGWGNTALITLMMLLFCAASASANTYTVTNTGDTGNGSLRKAVQNANNNAGTDIIAFNIPSASLTGGVAIIRLTSGPLVITEAVTIDGTTQTSTVGNTNSGSLGIGGTVGVGSLSLSTVNRPEVQVINGASPAVLIGFDLQASGVTIRGLSIYGFGTAANSDTSANIRIGAGFTNTLIEQNILGASATSFSDPGAGARSVGDCIRSAGADNGTIQNNLIGYSAGKGIQLGGGSSGWTVTNNEVRSNGIGNSNLDGIDVENGSGNNSITRNLFTGNEALGVDMYQSSGGNTVQNNTITGNGIGPNGNVETAGVRVYGTGNLIDRNIINANYGAGVQVTAAATQNTITRNSIYANGTITNKANAAASGQIGIDLESATDNENTGSAPYVTVNDAGDTDGGANGLYNFPVLTSALINGTNLILTGYARPGAMLELFIADNEPKKFGEGQTYLATLTEGSASDTDTGTGTYTNPVNSLNQGTDTTNKFKFTISLPSGVSGGTSLTVTATLGGSTSEFSGIVVVQSAPDVRLRKCIVVGASCLETSIPDVQPGTDLTYRITFTNNGGTAYNGLTIIDVIPFAVVGTSIVRTTEFKVGSMGFTPNTSGLTLSSTQYWNDSIGYPAPTPPWSPTLPYTPVGAVGAYDPNVSYIGWVLSGNMANGTSGNVTFTVRVR